MRACNKCKADVAGDMIGFEGQFIDWNYDLDLCVECTIQFKTVVDFFLDTEIDTNEKLSEEEMAEREPVSKMAKKYYGKN